MSRISTQTKLAALGLAFAAPLFAQADWGAVDKALGRSGASQAGGVYKYSFPRGDLEVTMGGVRVRPALALGTWVAFKKMSDGKALAMGDLVLSPDELPTVMSRLQQGGVERWRYTTISPARCHTSCMCTSWERATLKASHGRFTTR